MKTTIRDLYPVTRSRMPRRRAVAALLEDVKADYVSPSGRVKRWKSPPVGADEWCIAGYGSRAQVRSLVNLPVRLIPYIQCHGTYEQMIKVRDMALRCWNDLPGGQEYRHLFNIMFPRVLSLEVTPTIDLTKPAAHE